jgi:hypothetical protein
VNLDEMSVDEYVEFITRGYCDSSVSSEVIEVLLHHLKKAHAAGRTAGLQEAMGITLAVGDSVRNEYNDTTELAERHAVTRCVNSIKGAIEALK